MVKSGQDFMTGNFFPVSSSSTHTHTSYVSYIR